MSEQKLMKNVKEAATLVGISTGVGLIAKKTMKKSVTNDPSSSLRNFAEWVAVLIGAIYVRDYLISQKLIPD